MLIIIYRTQYVFNNWNAVLKLIQVLFIETVMKSSKMPSYFLSRAVDNLCCVDCVSVLQSHSGFSKSPHLCKSSLHLPCLVCVRLCLAQVSFERSMPKTRVHASSMQMPPDFALVHVRHCNIYTSELLVN